MRQNSEIMTLQSQKVEIEQLRSRVEQFEKKFDACADLLGYKKGERKVDWAGVYMDGEAIARGAGSMAAQRYGIIQIDGTREQFIDRLITEKAENDRVIKLVEDEDKRLEDIEKGRKLIADRGKL